MNRRPDLDDLDRELRDHIDHETADNVARGMAPDEARAAAIRKLGNVTRIKEDVRGVWIPGWADRLRQDARDASRQVRRRPGFSFAIVLTLALGIGLTTAIYSVVHAVLIRPLAYAHPDRMVWLAAGRGPSGEDFMNSIDFAAWQSQTTLLRRMIAYNPLDATIVAAGEASRIRIMLVSDGFWEAAAAQPFLGALPAAKDGPVLVLTHRVFRDRFNGDRQLIGSAVTIDGRQVTVGAVLPETFAPQLQLLAWRPGVDLVAAGAYQMLRIEPPPKEIGPQTAVAIYQAIGELQPGVSIEQARAEIETIHARHQRAFGTPFGKSPPTVIPLREKLVGPSRRALSILLSAAVVVLLIACANVAGLLLSRLAERRKEIALRMSVGSGPLRVLRQLLAESLAHAVLGGIGGILVAVLLIDMVVALIGPGITRLNETTLDLGVMAVAMAMSIGTAVLFGLGPAIALCFTNVQEVLKEGGRSVSASRAVLRAGRAMVMLQVALTIVLLAGAGLMCKSVWQMTTYPEGFAPDRILTMRVDFRGASYRETEARHRYATALLERAKTLPGVRAAALTTGGDSIMIVLKEGQAMPPPGERDALSAPLSSVSADFGRLVGMSLVSGRWFHDSEPARAVVINESLARRDFGNASPLGARLRVPWIRDAGFATIVGVVRDLKYAHIDADARPELFFDYRETRNFGVTLAMQIDGDPSAAAPAIRTALSAIDPTQSFYAVRTMEETLEESIAPRRFNLLLLSIFALVALVVAVLGVYSVVAYAVSERTHEIGIRLALGADRGRVVRMIVGQGMVAVVAGIAVGVFAALMATRLIAGLLYGVDAHDMPTFALTTMALAAVAFVACSAPAFRAALVDPVVALRTE